MKIDLHCHTLSIKDGESSTRNVTVDIFKQKLVAMNVEIVAITNHNRFDLEQFNLLTKSVNGICQVWAGVELDIIGTNNNKYHMIVICSPCKAREFSEEISKLTQGKVLGSFTVGALEAIERLEKLGCIFIPHFHKKPTITESEIKQIKDKLTNKNRLILEPQNVNSMGIFINHGISSIVGSDVKDWDGYPGKELPELRLRVDSFEQFCRLLDKDPVVVKTILDKKTHSTITINPCKNDREETKEDHCFYHDINVIMGDKGTGKTEVIKSLKKYFELNSISCSTYISSETADELDKELKTNDMKRDTTKIGIDNCVEDFRLLRSWGDEQPRTISGYVAYRNSITNKERQRRIQWSRSKKLKTSEISSVLEKSKRDLSAVQKAKSSLHEVDTNQYLKNEEVVLFNDLLARLSESVVAKYNHTIEEHYAIQLTNFTLDKFKDYTAAKTNTAPKPDNTGFEEYAINRLNLENAVHNILAPFDVPLEKRECREQDLMGSIGEKGKIFLERLYRLLNNENDENKKSKHSEFNNNITDLRKIKDLLQSIEKYTLRNDQHLLDKIDEVRQLINKNGVKSLDDFVGISKRTVNDQLEPYLLSNGERSILYIQKTLDAEAEAYLLDEPELSMANSYIDEVIRPRIIDLGRKNKIVIIATHNANLAVRTLPYTTMYRFHGHSGYKTYIGNPFTDNLVNIRDPDDKLDWRETSMKILEGGREAFNERKEIYG